MNAKIAKINSTRKFVGLQYIPVLVILTSSVKLGIVYLIEIHNYYNGIFF